VGTCEGRSAIACVLCLVSFLCLLKRGRIIPPSLRFHDTGTAAWEATNACVLLLSPWWLAGLLQLRPPLLYDHDTLNHQKSQCNNLAAICHIHVGFPLTGCLVELDVSAIHLPGSCRDGVCWGGWKWGLWEQDFEGHPTYTGTGMERGTQRERGKKKLTSSCLVCFECTLGGAIYPAL